MSNFKNKIYIFILIIFAALFFNQSLFSENIYFFTRTTFADSQFWERNKNSEDNQDTRKVFSNYLSGSIGLGLEMVIWDIGIKRGSRIFFKTGIDLVFSGINYAGAYNDNVNRIKGINFYQLNINGGAFYTGVDLDFFIGGTFPKTNLIWGFGSVFTFLFPSYSPKYNVTYFYEKFNFYATPAVLFGYDIFIPKSNFKITPQLRAGFTCNPLIPDDLIRDMKTVGGKYNRAELYSGFYIDFSLAFSFSQIQWKNEQ